MIKNFLIAGDKNIKIFNFNLSCDIITPEEGR